MISIFSRRELFITFSMEEQARVREALSLAGIDYKIKTINRTSPTVVSADRARNGSFGQHQEMVLEYIFYVDRSNYEQALEAIGQGGYLR